jgi:hypothetical protein
MNSRKPSDYNNDYPYNQTENETCPATKPEKKYINRNEREFPA